MSENAFEAILFDVDGTLSDSLPTIIRGLQETHERFDGISPSDADLAGRIGLALRDQVVWYRESAPSSDEMNEMISFALERFAHYGHLSTEFDDAVAALVELSKSGHKIALVTSKEAADVAEFLKRFSAPDAVDVIVCASDVTHPKPHPEPAIRACNLLGVQPQRSLMIGDSVFDLKCARAAGAATAAVFYGAGLRQDLLAERPDFVFDTPRDLLDWSRSAAIDPTCLERK